MLALAAAQLGYRCHVYAPDAERGPAAAVAWRLHAKARSTTRRRWPASPADVDVVTYEFENIPAAPLAAHRGRRRRSIRRSKRWRSRRTG